MDSARIVHRFRRARANAPAADRKVAASKANDGRTNRVFPAVSAARSPRA